MEKLPMTPEGHAALEGELKHRLQVERPRIIQEITDARTDDADISENAEYHAAMEAQARNEARIADLEDKLARAEVIDVSKLSGATIKFGATVTLIDEDTGGKTVWQIVGALPHRQDQGRERRGGRSRRREGVRNQEGRVALTGPPGRYPPSW
jgi:transcription elongation factor GreA